MFLFYYIKNLQTKVIVRVKLLQRKNKQVILICAVFLFSKTTSNINYNTVVNNIQISDLYNNSYLQI